MNCWAAEVFELSDRNVARDWIGSVMMSLSCAAIKRKIWSWRNLGCFSQDLEEAEFVDDLASTKRSVFVARFEAALTRAAVTCAMLSSHVWRGSILVGGTCTPSAGRIEGEIM
jgi:hypothetical protein